MATKKNPSSGGRRTTATTGSARSQTNKNDEFNLPAEPEVTQRGATSNPGRDPAGGNVARAARAHTYQENTMRRNQYSSANDASCAKRSTGIGAAALIGGAGLGAVLMYLLDPEAGERRRQEMKVAAARAAERSGDVLHNAWDMASEHLSPLAHRAAELGSSGMAAAQSYGSSLADRASDSAYDLRKGARRQMRSARDSASGWFGHEEESYMPSAGATASAITCLAAGVGAMYLLDPTDGARRRALVRDKANHWLSEAGDFFRKTGRHLANRSRGIAHETRGMFQRDEPASDRQLNERIRSRVGHLGQSSGVNFIVMDGRVTITGQCRPTDVDALLSTVQGTPGVASIVNLLDVSDASAPSSTV